MDEHIDGVGAGGGEVSLLLNVNSSTIINNNNTNAFILLLLSSQAILLPFTTAGVSQPETTMSMEPKATALSGCTAAGGSTGATGLT